MPKIANLIPMDGDRLAVILEPFDFAGGESSLTVWTEAEKKAEILAHVKMERERCGELAARYGGSDAQEIVDMILSSDNY